MGTFSIWKFFLASEYANFHNSPIYAAEFAALAFGNLTFTRVRKLAFC